MFKSFFCHDASFYEEMRLVQKRYHLFSLYLLLVQLLSELELSSLDLKIESLCSSQRMAKMTVIKLLYFILLEGLTVKLMCCLLLTIVALQLLQSWKNGNRFFYISNIAKPRLCDTKKGDKNSDSNIFITMKDKIVWIRRTAIWNLQIQNLSSKSFKSTNPFVVLEISRPETAQKSCTETLLFFFTDYGILE